MSSNRPPLSAALTVMLLTLSITAAHVGHAGAAPGLDRLTPLAGTWKGTNTNGDGVQIVWEPIADGTAMMARLTVDTDEHDHDMVTVYHMDGERMMLTHYCAAGNQPRMKLGLSSDTTLRFSKIDATNLDASKDGHMTAVALRFAGRDRLVEEWTWSEPGKDDHVEVFTLKRLAR